MYRMQNSQSRVKTLALFILLASFPMGSAISGETQNDLSGQLLELLAEGQGKSAYLLPDSDDYAAIPQDANNPLSDAKVKLGKFLFHETAVGTETPSPERSETYSCATCHHAKAGFKGGITQNIGDGGSGFARRGRERRLAGGMDPDANDGAPEKPDFQPVATPAALNAAYQNVMLWDGSLGNTPGSVNADAASLLVVGPPGAKVNEFGLSGLETQVLAGTRVHRLRFDNNSILQTDKKYRRLYRRAFPDGYTGFIPPGSSVTPEALGAAKAIAAYERTVLANRAPFQRWLRDDHDALSTSQLRGAILFFGKANCVACHTGPALSSAVNASADRMFFNVGFKDLDTSREDILGSVPEGVSRGRGNFTGDSLDDYKFKIPQLYNLKNAKVYGHGGSFRTIRQVLKYKNRAEPQRNGIQNLAYEFQPLGLSKTEIGDLEEFLSSALKDSDLRRYQPGNLPSGNCFPAADFESALDLKCW